MEFTIKDLQSESISKIAAVASCTLDKAFFELLQYGIEEATFRAYNDQRFKEKPSKFFYPKYKIDQCDSAPDAATWRKVLNVQPIPPAIQSTAETAITDEKEMVMQDVVSAMGMWLMENSPDAMDPLTKDLEIEFRGKHGHLALLKKLCQIVKSGSIPKYFATKRIENSTQELY